MVTWPGGPSARNLHKTATFDSPWGYPFCSGKSRENKWMMTRGTRIYGNLHLLKSIGFASGSHSLEQKWSLSSDTLNGTLLVIFLFILAEVIMKSHESQKWVSPSSIFSRRCLSANHCSSMVCNRKQPHGCHAYYEPQQVRLWRAHCSKGDGTTRSISSKRSVATRNINIIKHH